MEQAGRDQQDLLEQVVVEGAAEEQAVEEGAAMVQVVGEGAAEVQVELGVADLEAVVEVHYEDQQGGYCHYCHCCHCHCFG